MMRASNNLAEPGGYSKRLGCCVRRSVTAPAIVVWHKVEPSQTVNPAGYAHMRSEDNRRNTPIKQG